MAKRKTSTGKSAGKPKKKAAVRGDKTPGASAKKKAKQKKKTPASSKGSKKAASPGRKKAQGATARKKKAAKKSTRQKTVVKKTAVKKTTVKKTAVKKAVRKTTARPSGAKKKIKRAPPAKQVAQGEPATQDTPDALPKTRLSPEVLQEFRQLLLQKRMELVGDVDNLTGEALRRSRSEAAGDLSRMPIHMADIGSDNWEQEFTLGLIHNERELVREIDEALRRVDEGTYGVCLATRKPISITRLRAKPWAKYCIEYARLRERGRVP